MPSGDYKPHTVVCSPERMHIVTVPLSSDASAWQHENHDPPVIYLQIKLFVISNVITKTSVTVGMWIKFNPFCLHWSCSPTIVQAVNSQQSRGSSSNAGKLDYTWSSKYVHLWQWYLCMEMLCQVIEPDLNMLVSQTLAFYMTFCPSAMHIY